MVAPLRYFLIVLLIGLQILAPLVHAHVGHPPEQFGWHLPEIQLAHQHQQQPLLLSAQTSLQDDEFTLCLGSALTHADRLFGQACVLVNDYWLTVLAPMRTVLRLPQASDALASLAPPLRRLHLGRAPPA